MSNITDPVLVADGAPIMSSFGAGGQMYNADIFGGFNISATLVNPLFTFRSTDPGVTNAALLTNLTEANKIGSTMEFKAVGLGVRVIPTGDSLLTPAQVAALKSLLNSAVITRPYGSTETKIAEFTGMHLCAPVDSVATESTANSNTDVGGADASNFIRLRIPVPMQKNVELRGNVNFAKAPANVLTTTANSFGFVVILYGVKIVAQ